tara:strand:- start:485 stop:607 length:123 start_codon:yes stop_codon:yes gene_type:complete
MKVKKSMTLSEYQELQSIVMSWWFSLPQGLQKELREFYDD